jgi:hypothetical protein
MKATLLHQGGNIVHIDGKKLGRIKGGACERLIGDGNSPYNAEYTNAAGRVRNTVGWEYVHVAVDHHSRLAYARCCSTRKQPPPPYRPQTNGKAERFIRTLIEGWAYGAIYRSSQERSRALDGWLWHYNHRRRRHSALGHQPPISRTNLLGSYT